MSTGNILAFKNLTETGKVTSAIVLVTTNQLQLQRCLVKQQQANKSKNEAQEEATKTVAHLLDTSKVSQSPPTPIIKC